MAFSSSPRQKTLKEIVTEFVAAAEVLIEAQIRELARDRAIQAIQAAFGGADGGKPFRRRPPSPGRQLQGRYIGRLRKLRGESRIRVQQAARKNGIEAAIKLADKLLAA